MARRGAGVQDIDVRAYSAMSAAAAGCRSRGLSRVASPDVVMVLLAERRGARLAGIRCGGRQAAQVARRRTSQTVTAMSSADSASSQPASIHWKGQNRAAGW